MYNRKIILHTYVVLQCSISVGPKLVEVVQSDSAKSCIEY